MLIVNKWNTKKRQNLQLKLRLLLLIIIIVPAVTSSDFVTKLCLIRKAKTRRTLDILKIQAFHFLIDVPTSPVPLTSILRQLCFGFAHLIRLDY